MQTRGLFSSFCRREGSRILRKSLPSASHYVPHVTALTAFHKVMVVNKNKNITVFNMILVSMTTEYFSGVRGQYTFCKKNAKNNSWKASCTEKAIEMLSAVSRSARYYMCTSFMIRCTSMVQLVRQRGIKSPFLQGHVRKDFARNRKRGLRFRWRVQCKNV